MLGRRTAGVAMLALGALLLTPIVPSPRARADDSGTKKESRPVVDETQVYFGRASATRAPAVVDADRVYRAIPEYKKILDDKLTESDVQYSMLMRKASRKFKIAVEGAAADGGYDLVANVGAVTWEGHEVPDVTEAVLKKLEEGKGG